MGTFVKEIEEELTQKLIPFWENLRDEEYGGFYGYMGYDLKVQKDYETAESCGFLPMPI